MNDHPKSSMKKKGVIPWWGYLFFLMIGGIIAPVMLREQHDIYLNYTGYFMYHHEYVQDRVKDVLQSAKDTSIMPNKGS